MTRGAIRVVVRIGTESVVEEVAVAAPEHPQPFQLVGFEPKSFDKQPERIGFVRSNKGLVVRESPPEIEAVTRDVISAQGGVLINGDLPPEETDMGCVSDLVNQSRALTFEDDPARTA